SVGLDESTGTDDAGRGATSLRSQPVAGAKDSEYVGDDAEASPDARALLAGATALDQSADGSERSVAAGPARQDLPWLELRVDVVLFPFGDYETDDFAGDIAAANKIFEPCRIRVKLGTTTILTEAHTKQAGMIYQPNRDEPPRAILDPDKLARVAGPKAQGAATVYYVPEIRIGAAGQKIGGDSAVVASRGASGRRRQSRVLAHELAHVMGLPHDRSKVRNLMIDITEDDLKRLGLQSQWDQFKREYKGPTRSAVDLNRRFYAFVHHVIAASTHIPAKKCDDMGTNPLLRAAQ
ncbi:MAG: hypothetical protein WD063_05325, partial [Pirellulales bacterium]